MALQLDYGEVVSSLLLVKAVLAILTVLLFVYYKMSWERAKRHLQIHFFYAKWKTVRYAVLLGLAATGFAIGFTIELLGTQAGFSPERARFYSSIFEIGGLFSMLYVFFTLALEDVPHFHHIADTHRHARHHHEGNVQHDHLRRLQEAEWREQKKAKKRKGSGKKSS